jgi:hypothetical protein
MNRTLTLRLMNTPGRAEIVRQAVIALAVRVGMPPLAADRAGFNVAAVIEECDDEDVSILAEIGPSGAELTLIGGDDGWRREAVAALDAYGARTDADAVILRLARTPLRPV